MQINTFSAILIVFKFVINSDGFLLHGSAGPLTARLGGAVLLPCFVDRPLPLEELEVDWRRTDSDTIVHLFQDGQSRPESQGDAYRDRAQLFPQEIPKGNFSLLLEEVRAADAGVYKCVVYTEQEQRETRVEIQEVDRLVVTGADEPVYAHAGEDVTLSCSVDTHVNVTELQVEWKKTEDDGDIMVLLYADGENRPESQDRRYSGRAQFCTEEIPKGNFSMKLRKVRTEDKGGFRCEVHSDTDSASTTARIAALGYSSLHWLILGLCIAVTPVVLLIGALSVRHLREDNSRQALLSHCSHVTAPPIMVSTAFILWGVTEGSTEEAVTFTAISLLYILVLFYMAPYRKSSTATWRLIIRLTLRTVFPLIMVAVLTGPGIKVRVQKQLKHFHDSWCQLDCAFL
nr:CD276 antigen homolog [Paramormyrops kingsleyae]